MEIVAAIISISISSLIYAVIMRAAVKWVTKRSVTFINAYITAFTLFLVYAILDFIFDEVIDQGIESITTNLVGILFLLVVSLIVQSGVMAAMLKFTFNKACLISLAMLAIFWVILLLIGGLMYLVSWWLY